MGGLIRTVKLLTCVRLRARARREKGPGTEGVPWGSGEEREGCFAAGCPEDDDLHPDPFCTDAVGV